MKHASWGSYIQPLRLTPRLVAVSALVIGFTVVNVGAILLVRYFTTPTNPFSDYVDVFPGQSRSAVFTHAFSCAMGDNSLLPNEYCTLSLSTGVFTQVGVVVSNSTVTRTDFILGEGMLRLGDLVALWGIPDSQIHDGRYVMDFFWPGSGVNASAFSDTRKLSLFLPVGSVSFTDTQT
jgi:hypothetical protein